MGQQWTLSYLDHNVRIGDHNVCVGNSLIGVASPEQLVDATGGTTILAMLVMDAVAEAAEAAHELQTLMDRNPGEVAESEEIDREARSRPPTPVRSSTGGAARSLWGEGGALGRRRDDRRPHAAPSDRLGRRAPADRAPLAARPARVARGSPIRTNPPKRRIQAAYRSGSLVRVQPVLDRLQAAAASRPALLAHVG